MMNTEVYRVQRGDTMWRIAQDHDMTLEKLISINPQIDNPNLIAVGQPVNVLQDKKPDSNAKVIAENDKIPLWLAVAKEEIGIQEGANSHRIIEYHASTTLRATDDQVAWCSSFVNWCITKAGLVGTNSAAAKSWLSWKGGERTMRPKPGDIVVLDRGNLAWQGHVAFLWRLAPNGFYLLGGNQSNQVKISFYRNNRLEGYIRPKED